jgi:outer membrane protein OmpA-like peptidoglycan-associated protein/flagellar hook assembly protein FlgD
MKKPTCTILLLLVLLPLFADYNPPAGSGSIFDFYSPVFLGGGVTSLSAESPVADVLNPAASGAVQRLTLDFSYIGLFGSAAEAGLGNFLNAGITYPTRAGVLSGSVHLLHSPFDSLNLGTMGTLHVSFAKDLFPNLLVGAGLGFLAGADWGLGLDLGMLHQVGDLRGLKDFRWGAALRGIGKGYDPAAEGGTSFPAPFTPAVGLGFDLIDNDTFLWAVHSDVAFPVFQNVRFTLGSDLTYRDLVTLRLATTLDAAELMNGTGRDLPLSFGLSVTYNTPVRNRDSELKASASAAPFRNGIWGVGAGVNIPIGLLDRDPPEIRITTDKEEYISPNLDGVLDDLTKPIAITDARYVKGYRFIVSDSQGNPVREIVNADERPENVSFKNIVDRLLYVKEGIQVPESLRWDGRNDSGTVVADGAYSYRVEAWDDNGNLGKSASGTVIVDNTPPSAAVSASYLVFSPNGDGNKDVLLLEQNGSIEDLWQFSIRDAAGAEKVSFSWQNQAPQNFEWNGKDGAGALAADGVYSYRVTATDRAGNTGSAQLDNIIINTMSTPIRLAVNPAVFSPNDDGVRDTAQIALEVPVTSGIERWRLELRGENGEVRRTYTGGSRIDPTLVFDGRDDAGKVLGEGSYRTFLEVFYQNGNNPKAESPALTVDLTPPSAAVSADLAVFSPDGDGNKDSVTIFQETSEETLWQGIIENLDGQPVHTFSWRGRADPRLVWTGRGDDGSLQPDGIYFYSLKSADRAGNAAGSKKLRFEINTQKTEVFISSDQTTFSPNADGIKDRVRLTPNLKVSEGVARFSLRILDRQGTAVKNVTGQNRPPEAYAWDGLDDQGRRLPDGEYIAALILDYTKGDHHEVRTASFTIDTTPPEATLSAAYTLFSPDGDGRRDEIPIRQSTSPEVLWEGEIRDAANGTVRSFYWKQKAEDFNWDGRDDNGNRAADGRYTYILKSADAAGNTTSVNLAGIEIDTRRTPIFATVSGSGFSPNGDGRFDAIELRLVVPETAGVQSWKLDIVHAERGVQKSFSGAAPVPASVKWDGQGAGGRAPEGMYRGVLAVEYQKGNRPEASTTSFLLDVSAPKLAIGLKPQPFSPDNDGVDDELAIGLQVQDQSPIERWSIQIEDPTGVSFARYEGRGMPADRIIWNGLSNSGELVQSAEDYPITLEATDVLGNMARARDDIAVDVLVIREGDRLKIRITSIVFPANSPDLNQVADPENLARNNKTLKRLVGIFNKYRSYSIRIEGHANSVYWAEVARAAKEQEEVLLPLSKARAEAVKQALVQLGLDAARITTDGLGGAEPLVPFGDEVNRWKNRRVEFILVKKS